MRNSAQCGGGQSRDHLVEISWPVGREEHDTLEAFDLCQQLSQLCAAAVATSGEERLALVEEDECPSELRLPRLTASRK